MSAYDYFLKDGQHDQIKAWGQSGTLFRIGDEVRALFGMESYSILTRQRYYIRVENCKITSVDSLNSGDLGLAVFDHWGNPYTDDTHGIISGEPYFFDTKYESDTT